MQAQVQQIEPIFQAVAYCLQYPSDSPAVAPDNFRERQEWEEANEVMEEQRQEFFVLFKNTAKLSPELTVKFVGQQLREGLQQASSFEARACNCILRSIFELRVLLWSLRGADIVPSWQHFLK